MFVSFVVHADNFTLFKVSVRKMQGIKQNPSIILQEKFEKS